MRMADPSAAVGLGGGYGGGFGWHTLGFVRADAVGRSCADPAARSVCRPVSRFSRSDCIYIHTYIHTYIHACMHAYTHTYIHHTHHTRAAAAEKGTLFDAEGNTPGYEQIRLGIALDNARYVMYVCYIRVCMCVCVCVCVYVCMHVCMCVCVYVL